MSFRIERVTDRQEVSKLLGDAGFVPVDYFERQRSIADRLGIDLTAMLSTIRHIPLCNHGVLHQQGRKRMATRIAETRAGLDAILPGIVERHTACLGQAGRVELMSECIIPIVEELIGGMVGYRMAISPDTSFGGLFSATIGPAKRRKLNGALDAEVRSLIAQGASREDAFDAVAFMVLGRDALRGTIGISLADIFSAAPGIPMHQIELPAQPTRTGVPFIDRRVHPDRVDAATQPDQRAMLECFEPDDGAHFFGIGAHTCLGRPISLRLWTLMIEEVRRRNPRVELLELSIGRFEPFHCPNKLLVEVMR